MESIRHLNLLKLVCGVVVATCLFAVAANAQPARLEGKFTLPYEVRWDHAVLPAGEYLLTVKSVQSRVVATVQATRGKRETVFVSTATIDDSDKTRSELLISQSGNQGRVRSLNLPTLGMKLIYQRIPQYEEELLREARAMDTVPIRTAKK